MLLHSTTMSTQFCLLCLENEALCTLFDAKTKCANLIHKIIYCLDIKIENEDQSFNMICLRCMNSLNTFYKFKRKCHKVHRKLKHTLHKTVNNKTIDKTEEYTVNSRPNLGCFLFNDERLSESTHNKMINKDEDTSQTEYTPTDGTFTETVFELHADLQSSVKTNDFKAEGCSPDNLFIQTTDIKNKSVQCDICGKIYKNKAVLKKHLLTHTGVKLYSCKLCLKKFTRAEHEVVHMRAHRGIKPYICEICARGFTKRQDLQRHMKIHSDEKEFSCPQCDRRFKRSGDVHSHMRSHTGHRPYVCAVCHKGYASHSGLKKHYATSCMNLLNSRVLISVV